MPWRIRNVGLSLALHALILFVTLGRSVHSRSRAPLGSLPRVMPSVRWVSLAAAPNHKEARMPAPLASPTAMVSPTKSSREHRPLASQATAPKSKEGAAPSAPVGPPQQGPIGDPDGVEVSARERYLYELRVLIEGRRTYPSVSRRLGESGEVRVGFELHRDGSIRDVVITAPSPHSRLNEAALVLVQGLGAYRPFVAEIRADKIHVEIPVAYRLN